MFSQALSQDAEAAGKIIVSILLDHENCPIHNCRLTFIMRVNGMMILMCMTVLFMYPCMFSMCMINWFMYRCMFSMTRSARDCT